MLNSLLDGRHDGQAAIRRLGSKFVLNETAELLIGALAKQHAIDPDHALEDVRRGLPAARLLLGLIGLSLPTIKPGRPADNELHKARYFAIAERIRKLGDTAGKKAAAAELGISLSTVRTIWKGRPGPNGTHIGGIARAYWEPVDE